jgi:hypothetical protein
MKNPAVFSADVFSLIYPLNEGGTHCMTEIEGTTGGSVDQESSGTGNKKGPAL